MKAIIIDDEKRARLNLSLLVDEYCKNVEVVAECENLPEGVKAIRKHQPDLVLLDIEMPGHSGLELLDFFDENEVKFKIIFTTAYHEYALEGFNLNVTDYLLKPFSAERFQQALFKACGKIIDKLNRGPSKPVETPTYIDRLTIRDPGRLRIVEVNDISWIESAGNYIDIHVYSQRKSYLLRDTMAAIEKKLDPALFARIHRSSIVRKSDIVELRPGDKGDAEVILKCGTVLTMSRRNRAALAELFGHLT